MEKRRVRERAVKLVESALGRAVRRSHAQVPFADARGRVAEALQPLRQCRFLEVKPGDVGGAVELMAKAGGITAGQQSGARRAAIGGGNVTLRETNAVRRE